MSKINDIIEWDYCGSKYSLYIKHFADQDGRKGVTMIFEDVHHEKVTEIVVPPHKYSTFLRTLTGADPRYQAIF